MSFDPNILVSSSFGDSTRKYLSGSEKVQYYIHDYLSESIEIAYGTADTLNHDDQYVIFIRSVFQNLDPLISLDFEEVYEEDQAILRIYSVSDFSRWDDSTVGQVSMQSNYWDILWFNSYLDLGFDFNTIIHEIGHSLGLSHPNEDPTNFLWDTNDTVMSHNKSSNGWNTSFSSNDIQALQLIWGSEDDGLVNNYSENKSKPSRYLPEEKDRKNIFFEKYRNKTMSPSKEEIMKNPPSRSAKLRFALRNKNIFNEPIELKNKFKKYVQLEEIND